MTTLTLLSGAYAILAGISMVLWWARKLSREQGRRESRRPPNASHIFAELLAAVALISGGVASLVGASWSMPVLFLGFGMLLYAVVNIAGSFAERGERLMVGVLVAEAALTAAFIALLLTQ